MECIVNLDDYPIDSPSFIRRMRQELEQNSMAVLSSFLRPNVVQSLVTESLEHQHLAYFSNSTHNFYFTPVDPSLPPHHTHNRQSLTSKGCTTTDQIPNGSLLKKLYYDPSFQNFLSNTLEVDKLYPKGDPMSSITVHYATEGKELGWHFDSSAFAVTLLLQKPEEGGVFEYLPLVRQKDEKDNNSKEEKDGELRGDSFLDALKEGLEEEVQKVLDGDLPPKSVDLNPGTLLIFRGRDSLHRVTKVGGNTTRILVVFAYNEKPGEPLDKERMLKHFGRVAEVNE